MKNNFFETIRVLDAKHLNVEYHQKRYEHTLDSLGVDSYENLTSHFKAPSKGLYRCKIICNKQMIISVEYFEYKKRDINQWVKQ